MSSVNPLMGTSQLPARLLAFPPQTYTTTSPMVLMSLRCLVILLRQGTWWLWLMPCRKHTPVQLKTFMVLHHYFLQVSTVLGAKVLICSIFQYRWSPTHWFNIWFFNFTMVWRPCIFSTNYTLSINFMRYSVLYYKIGFVCVCL